MDKVNYILGLSTIDLEQKELFLCLSKIENTPLPIIEALPICEKTIQLWEIKSSREDDFLEQIGYPYAKCHKREHIEITRELYNVKESIKDDRLARTIYLTAKVAQMLKDHLQNDDARVIFWAHEQNAKV